MRTWPQIVMIILLTMRWSADIRNYVKNNPENKHAFAASFIGGTIWEGIIIYILALGGFWSVLGWAP